jgi:hypothetical protein
VPVPLLGRWTRRAKVFVRHGDVGFLRALAERLRALSVAHVTVGHRLDPWRGDWPKDWRELRRIVNHVFVRDEVVGDDDALLKSLHARARKSVLRALREHVAVTDVRTADDVEDYLALMRETSSRMRARGVHLIYPEAFFEAVWRHMTPTGRARLLLARVDGVPVAGHCYLISRGRLLYYHGVSTRDRKLTPKQGPSALFWYALRLARDTGVALNMGGVNPTDDRDDPQFTVTDFKRQWGGVLTDTPFGELVLSPTKALFQERVLLPLWARAHPFYVRAFAG